MASSDYASVDPIIHDWIKRHKFVLLDEWAGREARFVYFSSLAGECFQISISSPRDGTIEISGWCVEGRRDCDEPQVWTATAANFDQVLENVVNIIVGWMAPSKRIYPSKAIAKFAAIFHSAVRLFSRS